MRWPTLARPAEVVILDSATSPDQLDRAVEAARLLLPTPMGCVVDGGPGAARSSPPPRPGSLRSRCRDLATLLTREHGKVKAEAVMDASLLGAAWRPPSPRWWPNVPAPWTVSGCATTITWVPHGVVAAILPFNWPVSVMANKILPALLAGDTVVVKAPPTCPGAVLLIAAAMAAALPPGVLNVVNGPDAALGPGARLASRHRHGVVHRRPVARARPSGARPVATTRPVVLELGGNDPAILAPDVEGDAVLADRLVEAAFPTSGQVCMAVKRLYVHRDRMADTVEALRARLIARSSGTAWRTR